MKSLILFTLLFFSVSLFSQDLIVRLDSTTVDCEITSVDSTSIYFRTRTKGRIVETYLPMSAISYYVRDYKGEPTYSDRSAIRTENKKTRLDELYRSSVTIGILQGGGSLVGFDFETLLTKRFGVQVGAGLIGFGAGMNFHFKPTIRSSFVSLQYWHQGIGSSYTQSIAGANYVFRGKKWFTFQIGLGVPVEYGPSFPINAQRPNVILTYAIGGYIPIGKF